MGARATAGPRPAGRPRRDPAGPGRLALRARGARARGRPAFPSAARAGPGRRRSRPPREDAVLILVLDTSILRSSVLPGLAAHHFADLDADVAVVSGARGEDVIWSSRPGFPSGGDTATWSPRFSRGRRRSAGRAAVAGSDLRPAWGGRRREAPGSPTGALRDPAGRHGHPAGRSPRGARDVATGRGASRRLIERRGGEDTRGGTSPSVSASSPCSAGARHSSR